MNRSPHCLLAPLTLVFLLAFPLLNVAAEHWYRVDRSATLDKGLASRYFDYGAYRWIAVNDSGKSSMDTLGFQEASFVLTLGERRFDPLHSVPIPGEGQNFLGDPGFHLIQMVGPTRAEWITDLESQGLKVIQYIHPYTYVVWGVPSDAVRNSNSVRWTGHFESDYKVLPTYRNQGANRVAMCGLLYRDGDVAGARSKLKLLGATDLKTTTIDQNFTRIEFYLPGDTQVTAAAIAEFYTLHSHPTDGAPRSEYSNQINVGNYDVDGLPFVGYPAWLTGVNLNGNGVIMANVDSGIHDTHPDLVNRMISCTGSTCANAASSAHGTHTAGIMAGDGSSSAVADGFLRGLGVAPGANMIEQLFSPTYLNGNGILTLIQESYANGAVLSNNSWGPAGTPQGYDDYAKQVDIGVRDADPGLVGNQLFTYVLAFMNGFGGTSSQGSPDEAKNSFTIGSTKVRSDLGVVQDIFDLSSNTAHGPALDGRTIPHMVAPGCWVDSTAMATGYDDMCSTSMAAAHISGAIALFFEYYRGLFNADPSPALVKAAFSVVAINLQGQADADGGTLGHRPDSKQGWGRLDLAAVVNPPTPVFYYDNAATLDNTGESWSVSLSIISPVHPVKIMLVWTDAPGHGLGGSTPAWVNDLDLLVDANDQTYRGNDFGAGGWSNTGGGTADSKNNAEGVVLPPGTAGTITIRVAASNIAGDGVPGTGDSTDQDFSVVCYGCSRVETIFADGFEETN